MNNKQYFLHTVFNILKSIFISILYFKTFRHLTIISIITLIAMGFQAWLGKTVVDSNLEGFKITIHMLMALFIVCLLIYLVFSGVKKSNIRENDQFRFLLIIAIFLSLIQIILGTQVRQFVDEQAQLFYYDKSKWFNEIPIIYEYHRTFSIAVVSINFFLFYLNNKLSLGNKYVNHLMILLLIEVITGVMMFYFDFPFGTQTIHLVFASLIFGVQFYILLNNFLIKKTSNDIQV